MIVISEQNLMVPAGLQRDLKDLITDLLKDIISTKADGETVSGFTGYEQFLPVLKNDDDEPDQFFPYFIVRLDTGRTVAEEDPWTVNVLILLGIHDERTDNNGHYSILTAIQRITAFFCEEASPGPSRFKGYRCLSEISWALQDEDTYPYYFGSIALQFALPKPRRKISGGYYEFI